MSALSVGTTYSGGTAFVGLGSLLPTYISPFHIAVGGTALQQVAATSTVVGVGFGIYATYAGFFDANVHARRNKKVAKVSFHNTTAIGVQEDVGVHWLDFPAGYFPSNILAHVDDGQASILVSALDSDNRECVAETVTASVNWTNYPAGYFPLNIPIFDDNGNESVVHSALSPEPTFCAPDEAPVPIKWLEYATEYVPNIMDLLVDDEIPFGYTSDLACPFDSQKIEQAFVTLRNPPTRTQFRPSLVQSAIETRTSYTQLLTIALATVICVTFGLMYYIVGRWSKKNDEFVIRITLQNSRLLDQKAAEVAKKKKALEASLYKLGATPASRVGGSRHRTKKPKKTNKSQTSTKNISKHTFAIDPALESLG